VCAARRIACDLRSFNGHMMAELCRRPRIFIWIPLTRRYAEMRLHHPNRQ
jgi:hypothetical protein